MYCKDCVFWKLEGWDKPKWGFCNLAPSVGGMPYEIDTLAFSSNYNGGRASLETSENFGCVQFRRDIYHQDV